MKRAKRVAYQINSTGGYRYDGVNDCYGFVRRVWDPILTTLRKRMLPVNDYPDPKWRRIGSLGELREGDVVGTVRGHSWGATVHYGLFAGKRSGEYYQLDDTRSSTTNGAHLKPWTGVFHYYYIPTHVMLAKK